MRFKRISHLLLVVAAAALTMDGTPRASARGDADDNPERRRAHHWAFVPPSRPALPCVRDSTWPRNGVDYFVWDLLAREGLRPAPEADRETLIRRVTLDLTGLPPTIVEIDAFVTDDRPDAYERVVDRLLASPHFGERMALEWLDAARFADTNGYFSDHERPMWRWRDWVIDAFNRNAPFDQFTIEQLAGDLLPAATTDQRIASGFHRNHPVTDETGIIDEEYRVEYVADRVDTTATVWLGLTAGCARCHDHKHDPISQREYYQLFAFFNSVAERGLTTEKSAPPVLAAPTAQQSAALDAARGRRGDCERAFAVHESALTAAIAEWEKTADATLPHPPNDALAAHFDFDDRLAAAIGDATLHERGALRYAPGVLGSAIELDNIAHAELAADTGLNVESDSHWTLSVWSHPDSAASLGCVLSKIEPAGDRRGLELLWRKHYLAVHLVDRWGQSAIEAWTSDEFPSNQWHHIAIVYDGSRRAAGLKVLVDGRVRDLRIDLDSLAGDITNREPWRVGRRDSGLGYRGRIDDWRVYRRALSDAEVAAIHRGGLLRGIVSTEPTQRSATQKQQLVDDYVTHFGSAEVRDTWQALAAARRQERDAEGAVPKMMVMSELDQPRDTFLLVRGEYNKPAERVTPGVPAILPPLPEGVPANRLGLARWLVDSTNPLTARVAANRVWQQIFGDGLVRSAGDFGSQGERPTHPELLDWLAVEFVQPSSTVQPFNGSTVQPWDVKHMVRLIVLSSTYRQSSRMRPDVHARDPENRLLARGPRGRLPGEIIRDQALAASGLLVPQLGGPSVRPYQPPGLWEAVSYGAEQSYIQDHGPALYRRSLYTHWKRQAPPPAMLSFDAPTRETCVVRRPRTSTPLQALVLLNDPTFVEAARALATQMLAADRDDSIRLVHGFRRATSRTPSPREVGVLRELLGRRRAEYAGDAKAAAALVGVGESPRNEAIDLRELAAWTMVVSAILNLDEVVTKH
jgi:hypothetical protein